MIQANIHIRTYSIVWWELWVQRVGLILKPLIYLN